MHVFLNHLIIIECCQIQAQKKNLAEQANSNCCLAHPKMRHQPTAAAIDANESLKLSSYSFPYMLSFALSGNASTLNGRLRSFAFERTE